MECGLSAEFSLQETELGVATWLDCHAEATQHAATLGPAGASIGAPIGPPIGAPIGATAAPEGVLSPSPQLPGHSQLQAAGHEAGNSESSIAASVQGNNAATASSSGGNAASQIRRPLELLAASRARQSLLASAAGSASTASSMALSTNQSLTDRQMQQAVPLESSSGELPPLGSDQSAETRYRSPAVTAQLVVSHASSGAEISPVGTADTARGGTAEVDVLHRNEFFGEAAEAVATSEPSLGSSGSQQAAVTALANSKNAETTSPSDTHGHKQLLGNGMTAAEDAGMTVAALSAAETSVAASLLADASRDNEAPQDGDTPLENAAADEQTRISTSSSASSLGREPAQTEQDASASQPALSSNRSSGSSTAGVTAASLEAALHSGSSTVQKTAQATITAGSHAEEGRDSIGSEAAQAVAATDSFQHLSRSSTDEPTGADRPERVPSLSKRNSASRVSVSSHAHLERSLSPEVPAALNASLRSVIATAKDSQASISDGGGPAGSLMGASVAAPANRGESLTGASALGRSATGAASMGPSSNKLEGRTADAISSSLSQMGKAGGAGVIRHSVILTGLDPLDQWLYRQPGVLISLDYDKVKTDLQVCPVLLLPGTACVFSSLTAKHKLRCKEQLQDATRAAFHSLMLHTSLCSRHHIIC